MKLMKTLNYRITTSRYNKYDRLTISSLLDYCQDIAGKHADDIGIGYQTFKEK
ncbi:MAG: hypothetical protein HUJ61_03320, partial [Bacilli bacterium]|nr:hypothetical protein [Bacilli bacterium]